MNYANTMPTRESSDDNCKAGETYVYYWKAEDEEVDDAGGKRAYVTTIRAYGLTEDGRRTRVLRVRNFTPYVYVAVRDAAESAAARRAIGSSAMLVREMARRPLYGYSTTDQSYLFCQCASRRDVDAIARTVRATYVNGRTLNVYEQSASPILQFTSLRGISFAGWISHSNATRVADDDKMTTCDEELIVNWRNVGPVADDPTTKRVDTLPIVMAFDIEANSEIRSSMPNDRVDDAIFQISCVFNRTRRVDARRRFLLTLACVDDVVGELGEKFCEVRQFATEEALLRGFFSLVRDERPNVITGYNLFGFDIPYVRRRCARFFMLNEFRDIGMNRSTLAQERQLPKSRAADREKRKKASRDEERRWGGGGGKDDYYDDNDDDDDDDDDMVGADEYSGAYYDWEGVCVMDLYLVIKKDYKFDNYKLDTVACEILGVGKDPVTYDDVFEAYRTRRMAVVGRYCVRDSELCLDLVERTRAWIGMSEMAKVCRVDMFALYTQGEQLRVYSQVYAHCLRENIVVDAEGRPGTNDQYIGAYVFDPIPGYYRNVVPFDFASLYPSIIISNNIDYSTFVPDDCAEAVADADCNVFEWEDHRDCVHDQRVIEHVALTAKIGDIDAEIARLRALRDAVRVERGKRRSCGDGGEEDTVQARKKIFQLQIDKFREAQKPFRVARKEFKPAAPVAESLDRLSSASSRADVGATKRRAAKRTAICARRRFRFVKAAVRVGVMPTIIQNLLQCRQRVRELAKSIVDDDALAVVYDKRQLAYKVSANSMYGAMGVKRGYLPLMSGAMCVTYVGRASLEKTADLIRGRWSGRVIYGDTDSNYVVFPDLPPTMTTRDVWAMAKRLADDVTREFPPPMKLEFENAVYAHFFILGKKQYMYLKQNEDDSVDKRIGRRGVVIARRDNFPLLRTVYERVVRMIFDGATVDAVCESVRGDVDAIARNDVRYDAMVFTKEVKDCAKYSNGMLGAYAVKPIPEHVAKTMTDSERRRAYVASCPGHVQLAERMRLRGRPVDAGTRVEFVVVDRPGCENKVGKCMEEYAYFCERSSILRINRTYYAEYMARSIDRLLAVAFQRPNATHQRVARHAAYRAVVDDVKASFRPVVTTGGRSDTKRRRRDDKISQK